MQLKKVASQTFLYYTTLGANMLDSLLVYEDNVHSEAKCKEQLIKFYNHVIIPLSL